MPRFVTRHERQTPVQLLALLAAILAIATSLCLNIGYAVELGDAVSSWHWVPFALGAAGATLLAAATPALTLAALRRWQLAEAAAGAVLFAAAVSFSMLAAIGASNHGRTDVAANRDAVTQHHGRLVAEHKRLTTDLASIVSARTVAELSPLIAARQAAMFGVDCNKTVSSDAIRRACNDVAGLQAESARATERHTLADKLADLDKQLSNAKPATGSADPQASALAAYALAAGLKVTAAEISPWLSLATALFFELASALGLLAAGIGSVGNSGRLVNEDRQRRDTVSGHRLNETISTHLTFTCDISGLLTSCSSRLEQTMPVPTQPEQPASAIAEPAKVVSVSDAVTLNASDAVTSLPVVAVAQPVALDLSTRLLAHVARNGGKVRASQRSLALTLGTNAPAINRCLATLATAGSVKLRAGTKGTTITLQAA